jgi:hypothetical protein
MARKNNTVVEAVIDEVTVLNETPMKTPTKTPAEVPTSSTIDELDRIIWATKTMHIDTSTTEGLSTHAVREALVKLAEQIRKILVERQA